jgi:DNA primase
MRRYAGRVDCLLDGDTAGQKAALRALPLALKAGLEIRFLPLAADCDPDELFLEKGAGALAELDRDAESAMAFAVRSLLPSARPSAREKADALRELFEILAQSDSAMLRADYLAEACRLAGADRTAAERDFARFLAQHAQRSTRPIQTAENIGQTGPNPNSQPLESANDKLTTAENELLVFVLHYEDLASSIAHALDHQWLDTQTPEGRLLDRCLAAHREDAWPGADHLDELLESDDERNLATNLRSRPFESDEPVKHINECLKTIFTEHFRRELLELKTRAVNLAADNQTALANLQQRINEIQKLLRQPPRINPPLPA